MSGCDDFYKPSADTRTIERPSIAVQIPADLMQVYAIVNTDYLEEDWWCNYSFVAKLIRRVALLEAKVAELERLKPVAAPGREKEGSQ